MTKYVLFISVLGQTCTSYSAQPKPVAIAKQYVSSRKPPGNRVTTKNRMLKYQALPIEESVTAIIGLACGAYTLAHSSELKKFHNFTESSKDAVVGDMAIGGILTLMSSFVINSFGLPLGDAIGASSIGIGFLAPVFLSLSAKNLYDEDYKIQAELALEALSRMLTRPEFRKSCQSDHYSLAKVSNLIKYISWRIDSTGIYPSRCSVFNESHSHILAHENFYEVTINNQDGEQVFRGSFISLCSACKAYIHQVELHSGAKNMLVWDVADDHIEF